MNSIFFTVAWLAISYGLYKYFNILYIVYKSTFEEPITSEVRKDRIEALSIFTVLGILWMIGTAWVFNWIVPYVSW